MKERVCERMITLMWDGLRAITVVVEAVAMRLVGRTVVRALFHVARLCRHPAVLGVFSACSRRDLGAISARSRRDLGVISARSRRDLGAISA